jgi:hypothetical protein
VATGVQLQLQDSGVVVLPCSPPCRSYLESMIREVIVLYRTDSGWVRSFFAVIAKAKVTKPLHYASPAPACSC